MLRRPRNARPGAWVPEFLKRSADIGNIHRHIVRHVSSPVPEPHSALNKTR